jgi:ParB family transcriptional regulator, chromosome partitioning protein
VPECSAGEPDGSDVQGDQCLDAPCFQAKVTAHIDREIAVRPELVTIETAWRAPKEQHPGALQKHQYRELDIPDNPDAEPPCSYTKSALIVFGKHAGRTLTVCVESDCTVHNPREAARVAADPPPVMAPAAEQETEEEAAQREAEHEERMAEYKAEQERKEEERKAELERQQKEYEAEQTRRTETRNARQAAFERILANVPATFTAAQLRVFLRALVNLDPYDFAEDVAAFYVSEDENNQQTPEEVLSFTIDTLPDEKLTGFALRLVLTGHTDIPRESDSDYLAQAEAAFAPPPPKRATGKKPKPAFIKEARSSAMKTTPPKKKIAA